MNLFEFNSTRYNETQPLTWIINEINFQIKRSENLSQSYVIFLWVIWTIFRSCRSQIFFKIGVLKNIANFTEKYVLESLFNKNAGLTTRNFIKKRLQHRHFPVKLAKCLRTLLFTEHLQWLSLNFCGTIFKEHLRDCRDLLEKLIPTSESGCFHPMVKIKSLAFKYGNSS